MSRVDEQIAGNLARVRDRIAGAAAGCGRSPQEIRLVAVTKYATVDQAKAVVASGCRDLGESRPQQLWAKADALSTLDVAWHMVGHLQRNKVRRTLPRLEMIHSVDNGRILGAIDRIAAQLDLHVTSLLEVNISGETQKHGFPPDEVAAVIERLHDYPCVTVRGLMAMAAHGSTPDEARHDFARLRELRDQLRSIAPPAIDLSELSMGMSRDFEAAIAEGATIIRVGTALFEGAA